MTPASPPGSFGRSRRLRRTPALRALVRETRVHPGQLILPLFVTEAEDERAAVPSMPGVYRWPVDEVAGAADRANEAGLGALLLFGISNRRDEEGAAASEPEGVVQRALAALRAAGFEGVLISDVCLCGYTSHGHCGLLSDDGEILNDPTLGRLSEIAVSHARAGADIVAPSAMMDGQVAAIRRALDAASLERTGILSYSAKYASAYYGPFRDAAGSGPGSGDRRSHQMEPGNRRDALVEQAQDASEGADILMVKPGLAYLDIIRDTRTRFPERPLAAYNVSGEYSMVKAAAERGWIDEREVVLENLAAFRRAGADLIITYHALDAAAWLSGPTTGSGASRE